MTGWASRVDRAPSLGPVTGLGRIGLSRLLALVLGASGALLAGGCSEKDEPVGPAGASPTTISIGGASALVPFLRRAGDRFEQAAPAVLVEVRRASAAEAIDRLCGRGIPIAAATRLMTVEEREGCRRNGIFTRTVVVAHQAVALVANPRLGIDCLTAGELRRLWRPRSSVASYPQLDRRYPAQPVRLFGPPAGVDAFDFFTAEVTGQEGAARRDYTPVVAFERLVERVASTPGGLGFGGLAELRRHASEVALPAVDAGEGCVRPTVATVRSGDYPLARPLYLHVSLEGLRRRPVGRFLHLVAARADVLAEETGLVGLGAREQDQARNVLGRDIPPPREPERTGR